MPNAFAQTFHKQREALASSFFETGDVNAYLASHSLAADRLITSLAQEAQLLPTTAIVALGGYGRSELFPYSDLDVMVLLPREDDAEINARVEHFIESLWDIGLTVGHSVRSVQAALDEAHDDITVQTALLEARLITGNAPLFQELKEAFFSALDPARFFQGKALELAQRHNKFENTPYALEPNVKESPGGLRDLQVILWCSHAAGFGASPTEMLAKGTITTDEAQELAACEATLQHTRILLHLLSHRHEDRLIFDLQTKVAEAMGVKASDMLLASERLMKRYYINAKTVTQLSSLFMQNFQERLFPENDVSEVLIDNTFIARGYTLDITHENAFFDDPNGLLRCFYLLESSQVLKRLGSTLLRALLRSRSLIDDAFRARDENKHMFMQIIKMNHGVSHALLDMNQWGILGRFIPEFRPLVGQMQHDLFHVYTVDQHTMRVVRNLRYFTRSDYAHEYPICTRIMQTIPDNWRLVLAALFHDIGKGRGGHHEMIGAEIVKGFCERFDLDRETTDFLVFLVREHLTMSLVAQKQDLSNPEVIEKFAKTVGTVERLNTLFLLTVCDIRATGPKVWNQWKSQLLQTLYWETMPTLGNGHALAADDYLTQRQREAKDAIVASGVPEKTLQKIWKSLTLQYFLRHTADSIAWQTKQLAAIFPTDAPFVASRPLAQNAGLEIMVYCPDQPMLFARILAFLQKKRFSVLDARIYTTQAGFALDTFIVSDNGDRELPELLSEIDTGLTAWLSDSQPLPPTKPARLSRRSKHFPLQPMVKIEPDESGNNYLLSVVCTDRIGLLYDIAKVLNRYGVNLQTAKIMTMGERVEDVFMIDGEALRSIDKTVALEDELMDVLTPKVSA